MICNYGQNALTETLYHCVALVLQFQVLVPKFPLTLTNFTTDIKGILWFDRWLWQILRVDHWLLSVLTTIEDGSAEATKVTPLVGKSSHCLQTFSDDFWRCALILGQYRKRMSEQVEWSPHRHHKPSQMVVNIFVHIYKFVKILKLMGFFENRFSYFL